MEIDYLTREIEDLTREIEDLTRGNWRFN
jgi:hypothetical protein